jgi:predicted Zn finger-like uncharacterized protein
MEITCKRCQTEYDFDDALVSERGTTVRCTNCGEQFKVFRSTVSAIPERWVVQRRDGRELVFTNLRDLQRAITNLQVGRHDSLTRGSGPPRPLGAIAELEPFFLGRIGQAASPPPPQTAQAVGAGQPAGEDLPNRTGRTGRPPADGPPAPPQAMFLNAPNPVPKFAPEADVHAHTMLAPQQQGAGASPITAAYAPVVPHAPAPAPAPAQPQTRIGPAYDPPPINEARISYSPEQDWFGEPRFSNSPPTRSRALRWLVALFFLAMLGVAGATVGRKYVAMVIKPAPAPQGTEGRVDTFLDDGDRALSDGDLETAKESFDKASALAERDPRVLIDLARLDAARADMDWLKVRLLGNDQGDTLAAAKRQAQQSAGRVLKLTDKAAEVAPDDPKMARVKIDALRLTGDLAGARLLVTRVGAIAGQPETAYVLAALDLAEESPSWPPVIDRLKTAAAGEQNLLRARGALVYALVRSGDTQLAKSELEKISNASHPYPLLAELKAFVAKASGAATDTSAKRDAGALVAMVDARAPETRTASAPGEPAAAPAGDFRSLLAQAAQAKASRQYDRADQLYRAALASNPGDTEALAGLGDVARARGNASGARSYYEQVLAQNPHYLPALGALADIKWESGDHAGAVKLYRELLETSSEGSAAQRAKDRIAQVESGGAPAAKPAKPAQVDNPPSSPSPPSDLPPGVDTSDLPGFKR